MKHIHIPTIEELMSPEPKFSIKEFDNGYSISGEKHTYDLGTLILPKKTQTEHSKHASHTRPEVYKAASAPIIHAICKTLYRNKDGKYKELVEEARKFLEKTFREVELLTLSQVNYIPAGKDRIYQNLGQFNQYPVYENIKGSSGLIRDPATEAISACKAILEDDNLQEINNVYKWVTGKDTYLMRPRTDATVHTIVLGSSLLGVFIDVSNEFFKDLPALGIRYTKKP